MPGMDPRQMEKVMRQMGLKTKQIASERVIIETSEGNILITKPEITEIDMHGQKSYQISGTVSFEEGIKQEDITLIMEQAGCTEAAAREALLAAKGDIAEAILLLQEKKG